MYIQIGSTNYTKLKNISFNPEVDITSDSIPLDEFSLDIETTADISSSLMGDDVKLYDDRGNLWAAYILTYADRVNADFVHIEAASPYYLLERVNYSPTIWTSPVSISTAIGQLVIPLARAGQGTLVRTIPYTIDSSLSGVTIQGYCPEQNGRERLQWILFAAGAYLQQSFTTNLQIKALGDSPTTIPPNKTFWKPSVTYKERVTSVIVSTYSFSEGTPAQGDEYVEVNGHTYIITASTQELVDSNAPQTALRNKIEIDGMYLINSSNADAILSRLALVHFARTEIDADVINNCEYNAGEMVYVQLDDSRGATGYIESADFSFGVQARSRLRIVGSSVVSLAKLIINYIYNGATVATKRHAYPLNYTFSVKNDFLDITNGTHRYIFIPDNEYCTGTMTADPTTKSENVSIALHWYGQEKLLHVVSVTDVDWDSEDKELEFG